MAENTNTERDRAIMEGERNASLEAYKRGAWPCTAPMERSYEAGFTNGWEHRASLSLPAAGQEPVAHLWQHGETGRTRIVLPDMIVDADASWQVVGPLYLGAAPQPAVAAGWVMVPIEPTEEMLANVDQEVGGHCHSCTKWRASYADCKAIWTDMLSALPPAPSTEGA